MFWGRVDTAFAAPLELRREFPIDEDILINTIAYLIPYLARVLPLTAALQTRKEMRKPPSQHSCVVSRLGDFERHKNKLKVTAKRVVPGVLAAIGDSGFH
jgi:hypothetical protein